MNIAIVANTCWNINNFRMGLIKHLISLGHNLFIIAPQDDTTSVVKKKVDITFLPLHSLSRKGTNPLQDFRLIKEIRELYAENNIEIAIQFTIKPNIYGSLAARSTNTKTISNVTGLGFVFLNKTLKTTFIKRLFRYGLSKSDKIVFQNKTDLIEMVAKKMVEKQKSILINGSGINTQLFAPKQNISKPSHFTFLFIGRLLYDKGLEELIEAFELINKDYPNTILQIIGALDIGNPSAISEEKLKIWLYNNQNIKYLGLSNNLAEIIAPVDCVLLPSYREGLPKSMLEAMSMGKPIITSNAPGCKQLIDDNKNGLLCEVKNALSLYHTMRTMINFSEAQRIEMGNHGRHLAETIYDEKIIVQQYEQLINELKDN
jgi:glycosyltransferase involved in cell wall biosynthesis